MRLNNWLGLLYHAFVVAICGAVIWAMNRYGAEWGFIYNHIAVKVALSLLPVLLYWLLAKLLPGKKDKKRDFTSGLAIFFIALITLIVAFAGHRQELFSMGFGGSVWTLPLDVFMLPVILVLSIWGKGYNIIFLVAGMLLPTILFGLSRVVGRIGTKEEYEVDEDEELEAEDDIFEEAATIESEEPLEEPLKEEVKVSQETMQWIKSEPVEELKEEVVAPIISETPIKPAPKSNLEKEPEELVGEPVPQETVSQDINPIIKEERVIKPEERLDNKGVSEKEGIVEEDKVKESLAGGMQLTPEEIEMIMKARAAKVTVNGIEEAEDKAVEVEPAVEFKSTEKKHEEVIQAKTIVVKDVIEEINKVENESVIGKKEIEEIPEKIEAKEVVYEEKPLPSFIKESIDREKERKEAEVLEEEEDRISDAWSGTKEMLGNLFGSKKKRKKTSRTSRESVENPVEDVIIDEPKPKVEIEWKSSRRDTSLKKPEPAVNAEKSFKTGEDQVRDILFNDDNK
ncbi:MAG: hypothetical protein GXZ11_02420 [Tissierellia bacterium]|nr:hypothetical protein [Tissierellia bacterium]